MYDEAEQLLDSVIARTASALKAMSDHDIPEHEQLWMLVGAYITHANPDTLFDTAAGYAVALHRLVANRRYIKELEDRVAMLQLLDVIREL